MEQIQEINDVCKEVLTILSLFSDDLIKRIPDKVFKNLSKLAADSKSNFYFDKEKRLEEQNISERSKDLISLIYYDYIADKSEKDELFKIWNENERIYQENIREKYNPENIFKNKNETIDKEKITNSQATYLVKYKENIFIKIINKIKKIFGMK